MNTIIKFQDLTPEVYYKKSRDFQFIGRLFDIALNNSKMNVDAISALPIDTSMDSKLLDLLALTLGFKSKHEYNIKQLAAICSILPTILRKKGSIDAIRITCNALLNAEGITNRATVEVQGTTLAISIPPELSDLNLLKDLLTYILPAGMSCSITQETLITVDSAITKIGHNSTIVYYMQEDNRASIIIRQTGEEGEYRYTVDQLKNPRSITNGTFNGFGRFTDNGIIKATDIKQESNTSEGENK